ncbi:MAG: hypothetical protein ACSHW1_19100 [Yoonia sp.]|uniref:hypothetical protein n=1 Tax=Yoonia sp. TaxID=2212373 RepID=UPI003EF501D4
MTETVHMEERRVLPSIGAGIVTCAISPYMMILFPLVLPGMMNISTLQMPDFLIVAEVTFAALISGAGIIICFAAQLRRFVRSARNATLVNRSLAVLLMVGGGLISVA